MRRCDLPVTEDIVAVRGGGDLATGVVQKLYRAGIKVVILETACPTAIRRTVSLCTAVTEQSAQVEDMRAQRIATLQECAEVWAAGEIPLLVDETASSLQHVHPNGLVDAILAKKNLGTRADQAPIVIAMGPGFSAPRDAHAVIETMRGHGLGRVIFDGEAMQNTGTPGVIEGRGEQRVLRAPCEGTVTHLSAIGEFLTEGQGVFSVNGSVVTAPFSGVLRGLIAEGIWVPEGMKSADIDPRADSDCNSISDKARALGGAVLEAYLYFRRHQTQEVLL